jgi:YD repeat-containing protein
MRPVAPPGLGRVIEIDACTGNLAVQYAAPITRPFPTLVSWCYNAQVAEDTPLGFGWTMNVWQHLSENAETGELILTKQRGHRRHYVPNGQGGYDPPPGATNTLSKNEDDTFTETTSRQQRYHYSEAGKLTLAEDRWGNAWTYAYDGEGKLAHISAPFGSRVTFTYDEETGRLATITDPAGRETCFSHDAEGNLSEMTTPGLCVTQFTYDDLHRMTAIMPPRGYATSFTYDLDNRVAATVTPGGGTRTLTYDTTHSAVTDAEGHVWTLTYDSVSGLLETFMDPAARTTTFTRDSQGMLASLALPVGGPSGLPSSQSTQPSGATAVTYSNRRPVQTTNAAGESTTLTYDAQGDLVGYQDPRGNRLTITWAAGKQVIGLTDPLNQTQTLSYDGHGLLQAVTNAAGP